MHAGPFDIPDELKKQIHADEQVLWTGRPPQSLMLSHNLFAFVFGLGMLVFGWLMVIEFRTPITGRRESDFLVSLGLMILGAYIGLVAPFRDWLQRRRTTYLLTNHRLFILSERTSLATFYLNPHLETEFLPHFGGTGSVFVGGTRRKNATPTPMQTIVHQKDAADLNLKIRILCERDRTDTSTDQLAPFIRRAEPEHQWDADKPAKLDPLEYAEPVREKLLTNEKPLFIARPPQGLIFRTADWVYMPFAALWTLVAASFVYRGWRSCCPAVVGLGFVAVGLYMLAGRFFQDLRERRRTWYAVTDRRCLIVEARKIVETTSLYWNFIQGIVREMHGDGTATVFFILSVVGRAEKHPDTSITSIRRPFGIFFEGINDPQSVEALVFEHVMKEGTS
ncbi:MAG TPA: hypothetical protein VL282_04710 [Tepidisphaeraceae bacterium]|nr:hypothetical protein [Tepidisphaeraceae bacterium]